jgi:hypothetical protein
MIALAVAGDELHQDILVALRAIDRARQTQPPPSHGFNRRNDELRRWWFEAG